MPLFCIGHLCLDDAVSHVSQALPTLYTATPPFLFLLLFFQMAHCALMFIIFIPVAMVAKEETFYRKLVEAVWSLLRLTVILPVAFVVSSSSRCCFSAALACISVPVVPSAFVASLTSRVEHGTAPSPSIALEPFLPPIPLPFTAVTVHCRPAWPSPPRTSTSLTAPSSSPACCLANR